MADILKKFGRYFLLDQIAQGGMAEIYRARLAVTDGAGRLIVIKRIQAGFGQNTEFLQMFKSEIKVTMGFSHPNIVQLFDFGEEQNMPYIAMELVDGKNLRQYMNRFNELKQNMPPEIAAYIIEQSASGLHYAHTFKDKITGQALNIVHRDVSPQNIIISYEGTVKVIDFGIAKATTNLESTRAGVIKGKPSYLSPEQIYGEELDGRSDIFALGIVMWELLVGKKLFAGDNELAVLKLIETSQTHVKPPSTFNPAVPPELDAIVMKTLSKSRDKRYQTAEELQRALHRFLYATYRDFNPVDLAYTAKDLFKNEIVEDRKRIQRLNEEVEKILVAENLIIHHEAKVLENTEIIPDDHTTTVVEGKKDSSGAREVFESKDIPTSSIQFADPKIPVAPRPTERKPFEVKEGAVVGHRKPQEQSPSDPKAPAAKIPAFKPPGDFSKPTITQSNPMVQTAAQAHAEISSAGHTNPALTRVTSSRPILRPPAVREKEKKQNLKPFFTGLAAVLALSLLGPNFGVTVPVLSPFLRSVARFPASISGSESIVPAGTASDKIVTLRLNINPAGATGTAKINGHSMSMTGGGLKVQVDAPLDLMIDSPTYRALHREFTIDSSQLNGQKEYTLDVQLDPRMSGLLTIRTNPSADATITSADGKVWTRRTPFEKEAFPAGTYQIKLKNDLLDMGRTLSVEVKEGELSQPYDDESSRELKLQSIAH